MNDDGDVTNETTKWRDAESAPRAYYVFRATKNERSEGAQHDSVSFVGAHCGTRATNVARMSVNGRHIHRQIANNQ